ncbi:aminoglycoside phosphotransferase family protein [Amycolatopsis nigrescens]|uniref:aminoglycoside phosphotransferase family protein n=1 Tax=Amycolatopsis nigrescens TaxID=381445 RepID=UPI00036B0EE4|nr:aminoglycoside phosphotransferase family protein [Amycolatopsis nigrescens]
MNELKIPATFAEKAVELGDGARDWLASLPGLASHYAREWGLRFEGEPMHGYAGVVQPARRADGTQVALKLGWQDEDTRDEPIALSTWAGRGAVLMLEHDPATGVLLLELLDASRSLNDEPLGKAIEVAGELARRLAVPAPAELSREQRTEAKELVEELPRSWHDLGEPFGRRLVDAAVEVCRDLGPSSGSLLVNEDLHFENVLAGAREPWLVIDPNPLAGDLEFGVIPLLWNRSTESTLDERMAAVVSAMGLDADRARTWTLVRAVQNWLWMVEDEEEIDNTGDPAYATAPVIAEWAASSTH